MPKPSKNLGVSWHLLCSGAKKDVAVSQIGLVGLAVMGQVRAGRGVQTRPQSVQVLMACILDSMPLQNLALNVADKGFPISVFNRSYEKTQAAVKRAQKEGEWWSALKPCHIRGVVNCAPPHQGTAIACRPG